MAKCPNCGEKLTGKLNFCVFCGTNLKTGEKSIASELEEISKSRAEKSNYEERYNNVSSFSNGFNTGEIAEEPANSYYQPSQEGYGFETNILTDETEIAKPAAPVQTIAEVKQELPAPGTYITNNNNNNDEAAAESTVNDMEAAFANLGKPSAEPAADESASAVITPAEESYDEPVQAETADEPAEETVSEPETAEEAPAEPAMCRVVSCVGIDVKTAQFMLEKAGLKFETVTRNSDTAPKGEVMEQSHDAGTMVSSDTIVKLVVSCGTWSDWSENEPDSSMNEVESVTKYRTRTREKTIDRKTSTQPDNMEGYTLTDSKKGYGDWVTEPYFTDISRKTSESCEMAENLIGFKYCGWFYKGTSAIERNACCSLETALYFNKDTSADDWEYREVISYNNVRETVVAWSPISEIEVSETPAGDKVKSNIHMVAYKVNGIDYPLKYGSFETQWYKYRERTVSGLTYYFEKEVYTNWSEWSDWSDESQVATEFMEVETKVLYRYRAIADEK
ncbi:MAG: PASTA domain-containing protein [Oscillospiraceae bacterium]